MVMARFNMAGFRSFWLCTFLVEPFRFVSLFKMEEKIVAVSETEDMCLAVLSVSDLTEVRMKASLKEAGLPSILLPNLHRIVQHMQKKYIYICSKAIQLAHRIRCKHQIQKSWSYLTFYILPVNTVFFYVSVTASGSAIWIDQLAMQTLTLIRDM